MKSLNLGTDFDELIQAMLKGDTRNFWVERVIEFALHKFGIGKVFHIRSLMEEICIQAGFNESSEERYPLPHTLEVNYVGAVEEAHRLQVRGYTIVLEEGKLDDRNKERFFKIVKA